MNDRFEVIELLNDMVDTVTADVGPKLTSFGPYTGRRLEALLLKSRRQDQKIRTLMIENQRLRQDLDITYQINEGLKIKLRETKVELGGCKKKLFTMNRVESEQSYAELMAECSSNEQFMDTLVREPQRFYDLVRRWLAVFELKQEHKRLVSAYIQTIAQITRHQLVRTALARFARLRDMLDHLLDVATSRDFDCTTRLDAAIGIYNISLDYQGCSLAMGRVGLVKRVVEFTKNPNNDHRVMAAFLKVLVSFMLDEKRGQQLINKLQEHFNYIYLDKLEHVSIIGDYVREFRNVLNGSSNKENASY